MSVYGGQESSWDILSFGRALIIAGPSRHSSPIASGTRGLYTSPNQTQAHNPQGATRTCDVSGQEFTGRGASHQAKAGKRADHKSASNRQWPDQGQILYQFNRNPMETFFFIAAIYFALNYALGQAAQYLDRRIIGSRRVAVARVRQA